MEESDGGERGESAQVSTIYTISLGWGLFCHSLITYFICLFLYSLHLHSPFFFPLLSFFVYSFAFLFGYFIPSFFLPDSFYSFFFLLNVLSFISHCCLWLCLLHLLFSLLTPLWSLLFLFVYYYFNIFYNI